jgi:LMBR1 domain-containing protein 1
MPRESMAMCISTRKSANNAVCVLTFIVSPMQSHDYISHDRDWILSLLSSYWPLDVIAFTSIVLWIYACTIHGLSRLGVRLLLWKLYDFLPGRTYPHALILGSWQLLLLVFVIDMQILTWTPMYATFGAQFATKRELPCSYRLSTDDICTPTQISQWLTAMQVSMPYFSTIFFIGNCLFIIFFAIFLVAALIRKEAAWSVSNRRSDGYVTFSDDSDYD